MAMYEVLVMGTPLFCNTVSGAEASPSLGTAHYSNPEHHTESSQTPPLSHKDKGHSQKSIVHIS
jgi:hypothetical protein